MKLSNPFKRKPKLALFTGENYYPDGGALDCRKLSSDVEELKSHFEKRKGNHAKYEWAQIVNLDTMEILWGFNVDSSREWAAGKAEHAWGGLEQPPIFT